MVVTCTPDVPEKKKSEETEVFLLIIFQNRNQFEIIENQS